jgi:hypothetical protein
VVFFGLSTWALTAVLVGIMLIATFADLAVVRGVWPSRRSPAAPVDSAPRLYVETLHEMVDAQTDRVCGLSDRVPTTVLLLEVAGAAVAIAALALHLATFGR